MLNFLLIMFTGRKGEEGQRGGKGGEGGQGGDGGYHGLIAIENSERHEDTAVSTPSGAGDDQAARGKNGRDGAGGRHGRHGKAAGDVGFIDRVAFGADWRFEPRFYGFDTDECWEIHYHSSKPAEPYARCDLYCGYEKYADIRWGKRPPLDVQQGTQEEKTKEGRTKKDQERAVRKKAILRSHVDAYAHRVAEWNTSRAATLEHQMADTEQQIRRSTRQTVGQSHALDSAEVSDANQRVHVVKPYRSRPDRAGQKLGVISKGGPQHQLQLATGIYKDGGGNTGTICDCCRPVDLDEDELRAIAEELEDAERSFFDPPVLNGRCLFSRPTVDDVDSIFHVIFGQRRSGGDDRVGGVAAPFRCPDAEKRRKELAAFVKDLKDNGQSGAKSALGAMRGALETFVKAVGERPVTSTDNYPTARKFFEDCQEQQKVAKSEHDDQWAKVRADISKTPKLKEYLDKLVRREIQDRDPTPDDRVNLLAQMVPDSDSDERETQEDPDWEEAFGLCDETFLNLIRSLVNPLESFWEDSLKSTPLRNEYATFIQSPVEALGEPELELLAFASRVKIHIYSEEQQRSWDELASFLDGEISNKQPTAMNFERTLNLAGDDEHYVLKSPNGRWTRLDVDQRRLKFEEDRARRPTSDRKTFYARLDQLIAQRLKSGNEEKSKGNVEGNLEIILLPSCSLSHVVANRLPCLNI